MTTQPPRTVDLIVFDLDDTLLDTSGILLSEAVDEAAHIVIESGLPATYEQLIAETKNWYDGTAGQCNLISFWLTRFPHSPLEQAIFQAGYQAFYCRPVPSFLPPMDGALEVLERLKPDHSLVLVTIGNPVTQEAKVQAMGLIQFFDSIHYVDALEDTSKEKAFRHILKKNNCAPEAMLSVGNRIDEEIETANRLGGITCQILHGRHQKTVPRNRFQIPDIKIHALKELLEIIL